MVIFIYFTHILEQIIFHIPTTRKYCRQWLDKKRQVLMQPIQEQHQQRRAHNSLRRTTLEERHHDTDRRIPCGSQTIRGRYPVDREAEKATTTPKAVESRGVWSSSANILTAKVPPCRLSRDNKTQLAPIVGPRRRKCYVREIAEIQWFNLWEDTRILSIYILERT